MTQQLRVATLNIHKGLSHFNRRMVIHELRDGPAALDPDMVFLQEVQGLNQRHALRFRDCPPSRSTSSSPARVATVYGCNAVYDHGHHGNAILSRFPFVTFENQDVSDHRFERRGLLHCVVAVPGWRATCTACACTCRCTSAAAAASSRRSPSAARGARRPDVPIIVAGDFNDWRHRASAILERRLGMIEVSVAHRGRPPRTLPEHAAVFRLDRIYVRGFGVGARGCTTACPGRCSRISLAVRAPS